MALLFMLKRCASFTITPKMIAENAQQQSPSKVSFAVGIVLNRKALQGVQGFRQWRQG